MLLHEHPVVAHVAAVTLVAMHLWRLRAVAGAWAGGLAPVDAGRGVDHEHLWLLSGGGGGGGGGREGGGERGGGGEGAGGAGGAGRGLWIKKLRLQLDSFPSEPTHPSLAPSD